MSKSQFPHCLGAVDGKHVVMMKPWKSGSLYYNYKGTCSIVLMALVDADLKFIAISTGSYGRNSDGGIFSRSNLGKHFIDGNFNFPPIAPIPGYENSGPLPYVAVGDKAFPLLHHLMRPFPASQSNNVTTQVFNYRLKRARRVVENAFGVLATRWRVFHSKIAVNPEHANSIVKTSCVLHNFLQTRSSSPQLLGVIEDAQTAGAADVLDSMRHIGGRPGEAASIRNKFASIFLQDDAVPWQIQHVRRRSSMDV